MFQWVKIIFSEKMHKSNKCKIFNIIQINENNKWITWILVLIYLLIAIGLRPADSSTVHIYTEAIHGKTQLTTFVGRLSRNRTQGVKLKLKHAIYNQFWHENFKFWIPIIRTLCIYVSKAVGMHGYFSKPNGVCEHKCLESTAPVSFWKWGWRGFTGICRSKQVTVFLCMLHVHIFIL